MALLRLHRVSVSFRRRSRLCNQQCTGGHLKLLHRGGCPCRMPRGQPMPIQARLHGLPAGPGSHNPRACMNASFSVPSAQLKCMAYVDSSEGPRHSCTTSRGNTRAVTLAPARTSCKACCSANFPWRAPATASQLRNSARSCPVTYNVPQLYRTPIMRVARSSPAISVRLEPTESDTVPASVAGPAGAMVSPTCRRKSGHAKRSRCITTSVSSHIAATVPGTSRAWDRNRTFCQFRT
mmetsp:Transcript_9158/g.23053  ORF Transcript_9158/g.23053 Transcript_9158/m.23053 type:complete len:237 (-) Transcript_9158:838-1548(-)